jgi:hypothetical protein
MTFHAFYACDSTEEVVLSADAYEIELDWAKNIVLDILREAGDFFGLTDDAGTTLQFMREEDHVWMEIPAPAERGSYGQKITIEDVRPVLATLSDPIELSIFPDMKFQAW